MQHSEISELATRNTVFLLQIINPPAHYFMGQEDPGHDWVSFRPLVRNDLNKEFIGNFPFIFFLLKIYFCLS